MNASTRTPEGWPGRCPTCGHEFRLEPTLPSFDATCPSCGSLVWLSRPTRAKSKAYSFRRWLVLAAVIGAGFAVWLSAKELHLSDQELGLLLVLGLLLFARRFLELVRRIRKAA